MKLRKLTALGMAAVMTMSLAAHQQTQKLLQQMQLQQMQQQLILQLLRKQQAQRNQVFLHMHLLN